MVQTVSRDMSTSIGDQEKNGKKTKMFKLGSFNVRGLTQRVKQEQLCRDMQKYGVDVACIQETKMTESTNTNINKYRLICMDSNTQHYGNGFVVSPRWKDSIHRYWRVNDRISVLQLQTEKSKMKTKEGGNYVSRTLGDRLIITRKEAVDHMINIINVYAPTSEKVEKDKGEIEKVYAEVEKLLNVFRKNKSSVTFVAGDFNAKIGKRDNESGEENIMGKYSIGVRNQSGELFMDFCRRNEMFITNTAFQHPKRHIATWEQQRIMKETNTTKQIYNQIDYIIINKNKKQNVRNARTYAGTETYSDHRLLVMEFEESWVKLYRKINEKKIPAMRRLNTTKLTKDEKAQKEYRAKIAERAQTVNTWEEISEICKKTAEEVVGYATDERRDKVDDEEVRILSVEQKEIRLKQMNEKDAHKVQKWRTKRKEIMKRLKTKLKKIREAEIDEIADEVEKTKDDARMFKATKKIERKPYENPIVHDEEGKNVTDPQQLYEIVTKYFKGQFFDEETDEVKRFVGPPKHLNRPITRHEVKRAIMAMASRKAAGKDNLPVELLKYAPDIVFQKIADAINGVFEKHEKLDTGSGALVPLQKPPPKKKGPVKNLRPINLLPVIRKVLSKIGLSRSKQCIENHLSFSQSAYREGRMTTDIVWAYKWLLAKVQEYDITIYVTGIDMSSAFDTMDRHKLLEIAERIMDEDGQRILRILLSETSVEVRVKGAQTKPFTTNIGGPQGDSYSGPQFTTYFQESLKEVREEIEISLTEDLPEEMIYADDYDHLTEDIQKKTLFKTRVKPILAKSDLKVNEDKTEDTILRRAKHDRRNKTTNEPWRETIKLGSKLGDKEDVRRRKNLSTGKLNQIKKILQNKKVVNLSKKMKLYIAIVKSVLTYNACTWGLTLNDEKNLNSFHRKQLRQVVGIYYPHRISCEKLYKLTRTRPLSIDITQSRWKMFGHVLRLNEQTPARKAMRYYFQVPAGRKKFRGRKRATLITTLNRDITRTREHNPHFRIPHLKTELDLRNIRVKATNRKFWQKVVKMVTDAAYSNSA